MEAEVSRLAGAEKDAHNPSRSDYRCGYRPRQLDTRVGTMYLMVSKLRNHGCIPFFVTKRKRSETALIQVIQEVFVQGVFVQGVSVPAEQASNTSEANFLLIASAICERQKLWVQINATFGLPLILVTHLF